MIAWQRMAVLVALLLSGSILVKPAAAISIRCLGCHSKMVDDKVVHKPVGAGECTSCHLPAKDVSHPKVKAAFTLAGGKKEKLCLVCHPSMAIKKVVHSPVASGDCLDCHEVHRAPYGKLLKKGGAALCFSCHENSFKFPFGHAPVADGDCLACHDPHQTDSPKLLKKPGAQLCYDCHDKKIGQGKSVHKPVATGDCIGCHMPHGAPYRHMLKKEFPDEFYRPYKQSNYDFCFLCHAKTLAEDKRTDQLTGFRNGDRNLHNLHINLPEKGRTCKGCHNPHASSQDRLIMPKVPGFGKWEIPIRFTTTSTGGTCVVGCHKPKSYDRLRTVVNP